MNLFLGRTINSNRLYPKRFTFNEFSRKLQDPKNQQPNKLGSYVCPASFSKPERNTKYVNGINLVILDVDDHEQAKSILDDFVLSTLLPSTPYLVYTTHSSTVESLRCRVIVPAAPQHITLQDYPQAVDALATALQLDCPTPESLISVQPMFLIRQNATVYSSTEGSPFKPSIAHLTTPSAVRSPAAPPVASLEFLEPPAAISTADVQTALDAVSPDLPYADWFRVCAGIAHQYQRDPDKGYNLFDLWSSKGTKYSSAEDTLKKYNSITPNPDRTPVTIRSLLSLARAEGWRPAVEESLAEQIKGATAQDLRTTICRKVSTLTSLDSMMRDTFVQLIVARLKKLGEPTTKTHIAKACSPPIDTTGVSRTDEGTWRNSRVIPSKWSKGFVYIVETDEFFSTVPKRPSKPDQTDLMYSKHMFTAEEQATGQTRPEARPRDYLMNTLQIPVLDSYTYMPGRPAIIGKLANLYKDTTPKPDYDNAPAVGAIFEKHIRLMLPDAKDADILLDFLAHTVQFPTKRVIWAVILQGGYGIGKTYLARVMKAVLGTNNVGIPDNTVINSEWTDWAAGKQLIFIEEIKTSGRDRWVVEGKLKPFISNASVIIKEKYRKNYEIPNVTNYILFSNYRDAIALAEYDRRYCVLMSALQTEAHVEKLGGQKYFDGLFDGTLDNPGALRAWLLTRTIDKNFSPKGRAPKTSHREIAIGLSKSDLRSSIDEVMANEEIPLCRRDILSSTVLFSALKNDALIKTSKNAVSKCLHGMGYERLDNRVKRNHIKHTVWRHLDCPDSTLEIT